MTRDEMLNKLHNINVGVRLVALPSEAALECMCVTPAGSSYEWLSLSDWDWPAFRINLPSKEELSKIKGKLAQGSLIKADIEGTELLSLYLSCVDQSEDSSEKLNTLLSDLIAFDGEAGEQAFVLNTDNAVQFFKTYGELEKAFTHYWPVTPWEEHSDNALEEILGQIENGFDKIPLG